MAWFNKRYLMGVTLIVAILGFAAALATHHSLKVLVILAFAMSILYMIVLILAEVTGKWIMNTSTESLIELMLATFLIVIAVMVASHGCVLDSWSYVIIVIAFILGALFVVTSCDKIY